MKRFKVCSIQMSSESQIPDENIEKAIDWLRVAIKEYNPDLIVFPETVTTGFNPGVSKGELWKMLDKIPGRLTKRICEEAKKYKKYIVWPTYERGSKPEEIFNSALLIDDKGKIMGKYRKTHLYPKERVRLGGWSTAGSRLPVFNTPFAKIGIIICFDGDFPIPCMKLAEKGAEVIVRPSAFLRSYEVWKLTGQARAYDNHVFMINSNACGKDAAGTNYFGNSMIISPDLQILAHNNSQEGIICAELDPEKRLGLNYGAKERRIFDHLKDRNQKAK